MGRVAELAKQLLSRRKKGGSASIVEQATDEPTPTPEDSTKNSAAVALGRLGGMKGGKARADKLSPKKRSSSQQTVIGHILKLLKMPLVATLTTLY